MTDIQAALGISQLKKLPSFIEKRKEIAAIYGRELKALGVQLPFVPDGREHIYYRYIVCLNSAFKFMEGMKQRGVECRRPVFKPLHRYLGLSGYAATDDVWDKAVSVPLYPSLREIEIQGIIESMKATLRD
jgi:dTDP-4-amino-4,6-dideoxygalactose transaminase